MVVQHNMQAANANRMLGITTGQQAKSTEKLSSGYKINRAADDAAGLTISEKMRKQIRGLDRASTNAQDGVSAVQTAEGALTEVHSMLQRMNELATQSANGTNSATDRDAIQSEIDQLTSEIDRVSETTKFNETYLLKGDPAKETKSGYFKGIYTLNNATGNKLYARLGTKQELIQITDAKSLRTIVASGAKIYVGQKKPEFNALGNVVIGNGTSVAVNGRDYAYVSKLYDKYGKEVTAEQVYAKINTRGETTNKYFTQLDSEGNVITDEKKSIVIGEAKLTELVSVSTVADALSFNLHVGADSDYKNKIGVKISSMSAAAIGVEGLSVSTESTATDAIDRIGAAIQRVSKQRSSLGAVQNRLEHTIANLDNISENTTSAESRIRDTDMAKEMVTYSKNNILAQAGQSMLAQANQSNQGVLSLLQ